MPFVQQNTNTPFGLLPAQSIGASGMQVGDYPVSSSEGNIFAGDIVIFTSVNSVKSAGAGALTTSILPVGVALNYIPSGAGSGIPTSSAAVSSTGMLLVSNDPMQIFMIQDTTSGTLGSTGINKSVAILSTGPVGSTGGSTLTGRSVMTISGVTASSGGLMKVLKLHPVEAQNYSSAGGTAPKKYLVQFNNHVFGQAVSGLGVITS